MLPSLILLPVATVLSPKAAPPLAAEEATPTATDPRNLAIADGD
jgi:hypothetical protein